LTGLKVKAVMKTGIQYRKRVTDARFYKPPKRKNNFRTLARAVLYLKHAVGMHRRFTT